MLPENEVTEFENRAYVNPQLTIDEGDSFIDKLRSTQQANNQQIKTQTYNLGKAVPSNLGGLVGGEGYWTSRYQTPVMNSLANSLRATNRATALNQAMQNDLEMWKKRYNDAKMNYQKRQNNNTNNPDGPANITEGGVEYDDTTVTSDPNWELTSNGGVILAEPNGDTGGLTGRIFKDGEWIDTNMKYSHDAVRAAGADQLSDIFTGMYNYTLPTGQELELGGWDENLVLGTDPMTGTSEYYVWNNKDNTYTPVRGSEGNTSGGTKWWTK